MMSKALQVALGLTIFFAGAGPAVACGITEQLVCTTQTGYKCETVYQNVCTNTLVVDPITGEQSMQMECSNQPVEDCGIQTWQDCVCVPMTGPRN